MHDSRACRRTHIQERRAAALEKVLGEFEALERLRRLLAVLRAELTSGTEERVEEFLASAASWLAQREAQLSRKGLEKRFEEERIFSQDDDHNFRPPSYF